MYQIVTGPLLWIAFGVFVLGCIYRIVKMLKMAKKEKVILPYMNLRYGLRSLMHWLVPFGSRNMRQRPVMTLVTFAFHLCVVLTPIFLVGHVMYWDISWGISWWSLPDSVADAMTIIVIAACIFLLVRRLIVWEVFYVTYAADYAFLVVVLLTFASGFMAHHQLADYKPMLTLHILFGEIMLAAIPLTRLSHMLYFFFTRSYMGCEFGYVRKAKDW